jgi:hypothetical protein
VILIYLILWVLFRGDVFGDVGTAEEKQMKGDGASHTPTHVLTSCGNGKQVYNVPDSNLAKEVGVSAITPQASLSKKSSLVISIEWHIVFDHLVFASLEVILLLIGDGFSDQKHNKKSCNYPIEAVDTGRKRSVNEWPSVVLITKIVTSLAKNRCNSDCVSYGCTTRMKWQR